MRALHGVAFTLAGLASVASGGTDILLTNFKATISFTVGQGHDLGAQVQLVCDAHYPQVCLGYTGLRAFGRDVLLQSPLCRVRLAETIQALIQRLRGDHEDIQEGQVATRQPFEEDAVLTFRSQMGADPLNFCLFHSHSGLEFRPCPGRASTQPTQASPASLGLLSAHSRNIGNDYLPMHAIPATCYAGTWCSGSSSAL